MTEATVYLWGPGGNGGNGGGGGGGASSWLPGGSGNRYGGGGAGGDSGGGGGGGAYIACQFDVYEGDVFYVDIGRTDHVGAREANGGAAGPSNQPGAGRRSGLAGEKGDDNQASGESTQFQLETQSRRQRSPQYTALAEAPAGQEGRPGLGGGGGYVASQGSHGKGGKPLGTGGPPTALSDQGTCESGTGRLAARQGRPGRQGGQGSPGTAGSKQGQGLGGVGSTQPGAGGEPGVFHRPDGRDLPEGVATGGDGGFGGDGGVGSGRPRLAEPGSPGKLGEPGGDGYAVITWAGREREGRGRENREREDREREER
ncbi:MULTISPECIES: hypothetical protein [Streptomyces]|uniref:hypothetical protein n=1 Tax=Streptomyces TaxID=1883 RepID=UPI00166FB8CE|nr:hypothetical protein [Streptomyces ruber]